MCVMKVQYACMIVTYMYECAYIHMHAATCAYEQLMIQRLQLRQHARRLVLEVREICIEGTTELGLLTG
jgi:hypothetical protein